MGGLIPAENSFAEIHFLPREPNIIFGIFSREENAYFCCFSLHFSIIFSRLSLPAGRRKKSSALPSNFTLRPEQAQNSAICFRFSPPRRPIFITYYFFPPLEDSKENFRSSSPTCSVAVPRNYFLRWHDVCHCLPVYSNDRT